jgi:hypothetical protein
MYAVRQTLRYNGRMKDAHLFVLFIVALHNHNLEIVAIYSI